MGKEKRTIVPSPGRFVYAFLVTALATLVVAVVFVPKSPTQHVARVALGYRQSAPLDDPSEVWNELLPPQLVLQVAREVSLFGEREIGPEQQQYLKTHLQLQTRAGEQPGLAFAKIYFQHQHAEKASAFLDTLAERLMSQQPPGGEMGHMAQTGVAPSPRTISHAEHTRGDVRRASLVIHEGALDDPELIETRNELELAKIRYARLRDAAGESSPLVQDLGFEIERLAALLEKMSSHGTLVRDADATHYVAEWNQEKPRLLAAHHLPNDEQLAQRITDVPYELKILKPAEIVNTFGGAVSGRRMLWLLQCCAAFGLLGAWTSTRPKPVQIIASESQVKSVSSTPVIGSVFPSRKKVKPANAPPFRWIGSCLVRGSELALVLFVGFLIFCAASDSSFRTRLGHDPLAAYSSAVTTHLLTDTPPASR